MVVIATGMGVAVGEQQAPSMVECLGDQGLTLRRCAGVEGQVVESGAVRSWVDPVMAGDSSTTR
jgi:hypothetical protein